jgi:hypothetical protein
MIIRRDSEFTQQVSKAGPAYDVTLRGTTNNSILRREELGRADKADMCHSAVWSSPHQIAPHDNPRLVTVCIQAAATETLHQSSDNTVQQLSAAQLCMQLLLLLLQSSPAPH